jgi:N-acetylglucosaminyl-diphospho-decaprenol L-rhamnosyltransferase
VRDDDGWRAGMPTGQRASCLCSATVGSLNHSNTFAPSSIGGASSSTLWNHRRVSTVDVVIPSFNARELILRCLQRLDDPAIAQTVVVDDASTDGTSHALSESFPDVRVVVLDHHRGLAHALNRGAEAGTAEFVLFLNNDVFPINGAIGHLFKALRDNPLAASAGGRLVDPETERTQDTYQPRALPGLMGLTVRLSGIERAWPRNPWTGQHLRHPLDAVATVQTDRQPAGACVLVRREAFEQVQGWDEGYWFWYEDVDLSRRLAELGDALYVPTAMFEHVGRASTSGWPRHEQHKRLYHGTLRYAEQHLPRWQQVLLGILMVMAMIPRIAWFGIRSQPDALSSYRHLLSEGWALVAGQVLLPAPGGPTVGNRRATMPR